VKDIACVNGSFAGRDDGVKITIKINRREKSEFRVDAVKEMKSNVQAPYI
jgi:hypothetical protein